MEIDNLNCVDDATTTRRNDMVNDTIITAGPIPITRRPHYFQGRPNTVFLQRFRTSGTGRVARPA
jgi:hypothetical protein